MTEYAKWDRFASALSDNDDSDDIDSWVGAERSSRQHEAVQTSFRNDAEALAQPSSLPPLQAMEAAAGGSSLGFQTLKGKCVALLQARDSAERSVLLTSCERFHTARLFSFSLSACRNLCLEGITAVFNTLESDQARAYSQFALLPVLLLLREAAESSSISRVLSDRTVELALIVVQAVAHRAQHCESLFCLVSESCAHQFRESDIDFVRSGKGMP